MGNMNARRIALAATFAFTFGLGANLSVNAQNAQPTTPPAAGPSPSKIAVENRRAAYLLIGNAFRYFGAVSKGAAAYDEKEAAKRAERIAFLTSVIDESFPEGSNPREPDSKAKPDIWSNRADFDKKLKDFQSHAQAFVEVNAKEKGATEAFKSAVATLAQDCKGCHETYKAK